MYSRGQIHYELTSWERSCPLLLTRVCQISPPFFIHYTFVHRRICTFTISCSTCHCMLNKTLTGTVSTDSCITYSTLQQETKTEPRPVHSPGGRQIRMRSTSRHGVQHRGDRANCDYLAIDRELGLRCSNAKSTMKADDRATKLPNQANALNAGLPRGVRSNPPCVRA